MNKNILLVAAMLATLLAYSRADTIAPAHPGPVRWTCSLAVCFAYHDDGEVVAIQKYGTIKIGTRP